MTIPLPDAYYRWLYTLDLDETVEHSGRSWWLSSEAQLTEDVNVDGKSTPSWQQLSSFVATFQECTGLAETQDQDGNAVPLSRLGSCVVIGDDNGDPLFVDPSDGFSVWCYHHDGGDVERLCASLDQFMADATQSQE